MTQTATGALEIVQARDLAYEVFRQSRWLQLSASAFTDRLANAYTVQIGTLEEGGSVQNRTRAQLLTGPTYAVSGVTQITVSRKNIRAWEALDLDDYTALGVGPSLENYMSNRLGVRTAVHLDDELRGIVSGLTFDSVDGSGNDNDITAGSSTNHVNLAWPHDPTNAATTTALINAIKQAHMLLAIKNVVNGMSVGMGGAEMIAFMCPIPIAKMIVDYLESEGSLLTQNDIAGAAIIDRSIGTRGGAYMGTAYGYAQIIGSNSCPIPTSGNWFSYAVPYAGPLQATLLPGEVDEQRYGQGTTEGAYVYRRTVISKWGGVVLRPEHIIRVQVTGG